MKPIDFFKLQAKNLHRDYKTQTSSSDEAFNRCLYDYNPKYFDIVSLILDYKIDEENFTLMNAQHLIAHLVGFTQWTKMLKASDAELQFAKLLFDNMHKISAGEWDEYIFAVEYDNDVTFDDEGRLEIFKQVFANVVGHQSFYRDYRLYSSEKNYMANIKSLKRITTSSGIKITALPIKGHDRDEFVQTANNVFETLMLRMEPRHPQIVRTLWNPEFYIDKVLLREDMLPLDRDYALSMIDAFLVHEVLELSIQADKLASRLN